MNEYALQLIERHQRSGVLVDTNLLLLYFVGSFRKDLIARFKRTEVFTVEDFDLLVRLLGLFTKVVTTPNILTETSNLAGQLRSDLKEGLFGVFAAGINILEECHIPSAEAAKSQEFVRFGLTDAVMANLARENYLILTAEYRLSQYLQSLGIDVINFNHLRDWS